MENSLTDPIIDYKAMAEELLKENKALEKELVKQAAKTILSKINAGVIVSEYEEKNEQLKELIGRANTLLHRIDDQYQDMPEEYNAYVEDCVKILKQ